MVHSIDALELSKEEIEQAVKGKCKTHINFDMHFTRDDNSECESCNFCKGSSIKSLYDPKVENVCIVYASAEDEYNRVLFITDFGIVWKLPFFEFTTLKEDTSYNPKQVIIKAVSSSDKEIVLYDSKDVTNLVLDECRSSISAAFTNKNTYNKYIATFVHKSSTKQLFLHHYAITHVYSRECGTNVLKQLGVISLPCHTSSPTSSPSISPSSLPSSSLSSPPSSAPTN